MSMRDTPMRSGPLAGLALAVLATSLSAAEPLPGIQPRSHAPKLGTPMSAEDIASWNLTIFPDGRGLPAGQGTPDQGRSLFVTHCERCHGVDGRGATADELVGPPTPPTDADPNKSIGSYWPYATTIFDFIRRNKPPENSGSLSNDELYSLTAYLLAANQIIGEQDVMNAKTLAQVKMPNRDGFIRIDAP